MANLPKEFLDSLEEVRQGQDLSFLRELQKPETIQVNADARSLHKVLKLVKAINEASVRSGMDKWFSEDSPYSIKELPKHEAFFAAGAIYPERLFMAANRCHAAGTMVWMADGTEKPIEDVQVGDTVLAFDKTAETLVPSTVVDTYAGIADNVYEWYTPTSSRSICSTDDHEFLVRSQRGVLRNVEAKQLKYWDKVVVITENQQAAVALKKGQKLPKQEVYCITVDHPDHLFVANGYVNANCGKSICGAYEDACHVTGIYPEWWTGKRFDHPVDIWVVGPDAVTVRETLQKELLGPLGEEGTGMLPAHVLGKATGKQGVVGAVDRIRIKHVSGGWSTISFKNYKQDLQAFMGAAVHVVHLDEECPIEIWNECNIRTATTDGIMYATFTPLSGYSRMVVNFCKNADFLMGAKPLVSGDVEEDGGDELVGQHKKKAVIQAGWDDAPWLTPEIKERLLADTPIHLREARSKGIPSMEGGSVFTTPLESVLVEPFAIPDTWPRMYGLDVGWNITAAVWGALDPNSDTIYLYDEHYQGEQLPQHHAHAIKMRGEWIRGVIDPAAEGRSQADGTQLMRSYKQLGLRLMPADNALEAGLHQMNEMFSTGRLKIFTTLKNLQKEYMLYRRKLNGKIDQHCDDHAIDAARYIINNKHRMVTRMEGLGSSNISYKPTRYDV